MSEKLTSDEYSREEYEKTEQDIKEANQDISPDKSTSDLENAVVRRKNAEAKKSNLYNAAWKEASDMNTQLDEKKAALKDFTDDPEAQISTEPITSIYSDKYLKYCGINERLPEEQQKKLSKLAPTAYLISYLKSEGNYGLKVDAQRKWAEVCGEKNFGDFSHHYHGVPHVARELIDNRDTVVALIKSCPDAFNRIQGHGMFSDWLFSNILGKVDELRKEDENIDYQPRNDRELMKLALVMDNKYYFSASEELRADKKFALFACRRGLEINKLPEQYQNDPDFLRARNAFRRKR